LNKFGSKSRNQSKQISRNASRRVSRDQSRGISRSNSRIVLSRLPSMRSPNKTANTSNDNAVGTQSMANIPGYMRARQTAQLKPFKMRSAGKKIINRLKAKLLSINHLPLSKKVKFYLKRMESETRINNISSLNEDIAIFQYNLKKSSVFSGKWNA
jgi:hypothetical protein